MLLPIMLLAAPLPSMSSRLSQTEDTQDASEDGSRDGVPDGTARGRNRQRSDQGIEPLIVHVWAPECEYRSGSRAPPRRAVECRTKQARCPSLLGENPTRLPAVVHGPRHV